MILKEDILNIKKEIQKELNLKNINQVVDLEKVTLNLGIKNLLKYNQSLETLMQDLFLITNQKAQIIKTKSAHDGFKLKANEVNALKVTLRSHKMYNFILKLLLSLSRTKDYRGLKKNTFDKQGNISFGITDHSTFYDINRKYLKFIFGFNISFTFKSNNNKISKNIMSKMYMEKVGFVFQN